MAYKYVHGNTQITKLGWTQLMLERLWGEIRAWAVYVEGLHQCANVKDMTRRQAFTGQKVSLVHTRLLPIFSVLKIWRPGTSDSDSTSAQKPYYTYALYVGPDLLAPATIRVAFLSRFQGKNRVYIYRTANYKGVSDGGDIDVREHVERGLNRMLRDSSFTAGNGDNEDGDDAEEGSAAQAPPSPAPVVTEVLVVAGDHVVSPETWMNPSNRLRRCLLRALKRALWIRFLHPPTQV
jgi:hypothetical protein